MEKILIWGGMIKVTTVICLLFFGMVCLCLSSSAYSKTYVWTDKNGKTHFTDSPPRPGQAAQPQRPSQRSYKFQKPARQKKVESPQVELYITSWCQYCKKAIQYFEYKNIRYKTYDIEKDPKAAKRMSKLAKSVGVPFAVINGRHISGYAPDLYTKALKKK